MSTLKVFVSYCHEGMDHDVLDYFVYLLRETSQGKIEIEIDKDLNYGGDLDQFMSHLEKVDVVIIILTPSYKRKVTERRDGVYEEYSRIIMRYLELEELLHDQDQKISEVPGYFELIPVLLSGTHETSVPQEISHVKYLTLSGLFVRRDRQGKFTIPKRIQDSYVPEIRRVVDRMVFLATRRSQSYEQLYDDYFQRLFVELKADWRNPRDVHHNYPKQLFVKTFTYRKVSQQSVYFIIGRKGSGKSTITDLLRILNSNSYKGYVSIVADDFDLELAFALFNSQQIRSDTKFVFSRVTAFEFAWEAFIYLCCMVVLINDTNQQNGKTHKLILASLRRQHDAIVRDRGDVQTSTLNRALFAYSWDAVVRYMQKCVEEARSDERYFLSDIQLQFDRDRFLKFAIGEEVVGQIEQMISTSRQRFLVTLDGFDTKFNEFRRVSINDYDSITLHTRSAFEIDWLRALLHVVITIKEGREHKHEVGEKMDFCITVPDDRFYEIFHMERDSYRYIHRYRSLDWSGIELAILVRKRLEELWQYSTNKVKRPAERLAEIWRTQLAHIPSDVELDHNSRHYKMPLFLYVLRHTFWRPRDVLLYYASIIAAAEDLRRRHQSMSNELIRRFIRDTTTYVVVSEFIIEFESVIINIEDIVERFRGSGILLAFSEVGERISNTDFRFASGDLVTTTTEEKINLLYRLGFLGIRISPELQEELDIRSQHVFYFNEGLSVLRRIGTNRFKNLKYLIHPVFTDYLHLDTSGVELILELNWDYLYEMEAVISGGGFSRV